MLAVAANSQPPRTVEQDYRLGGAIGSCLVVKCQVFSGYILSDSPKSGEAVLVQAQEVLQGGPLASETVSLSWELRHTNGEPFGAPLDAWRNVRMSRGTPVMVLIALERGFGVTPGEPVLVTDTQREMEVIRGLVEKARAFESSPSAITAAVASLNHTPDPALAAYLYTFVLTSKAFTDQELHTQVLSQLVGCSSVPSDRWAELARWSILGYYALSPSAREAVVRRFTHLAQQTNVQAAAASFAGLAKIATIDDTMRTFLSPAALTGLANAYGDLQKTKKLSRLPALEIALGLEHQPTK